MAALTSVSDRRWRPRRTTDELRAWLPVILSIVSTIIALMLAYGRIGSRLDLIEYRLDQMQRVLTARPYVP